MSDIIFNLSYVNITLTNYVEPTVSGFCQRFEKLIADLSEQEKGFELLKEPVTVHGAEKLPKELPEFLVSNYPEAHYVDNLHNIRITYEHFEKRLIATMHNLEYKEVFKSLILEIIAYQSNRLSGLGYNFESIFEVSPDRTLLKALSTEVQKTDIKNKQLESFSAQFLYNDEDYTKSFEAISSNDKQKVLVSSNFHYDKFKTVVSAPRIRDFICQQIEQSFFKSIDEFLLISKQLVTL